MPDIAVWVRKREVGPQVRRPFLPIIGPEMDRARRMDVAGFLQLAHPDVGAGRGALPGNRGISGPPLSRRGWSGLSVPSGGG